MQAAPLSPLFIDYNKSIDYSPAGNVQVAKIDNTTNDLFYLTYVYDLGSQHIKTLPLASEYFKYLGTDKYTPEEISKEFYKLGVSYGMSVSDHRTYFYLTGLRENMDKGIALFEHLLKHLKADKHRYSDVVKKIAKDRQNAKSNKDHIFWNGLYNRAVHDEQSPYLTQMSMAEIAIMNPELMVQMIRDFKEYKHEVFYYGKDVSSIAAKVKNHHHTPSQWKETPTRKKPSTVDASSKIYFYDYDMVQSEIAFVTKDIPFNLNNMALISVFNEYFGSGLSSIVFQEIRESKSLAYSAFVRYSTPSEKDDDHLIYAYIGTQANKLPDAVKAMSELLNDLPYSEEQFNSAKAAALKKIESERITKQKIYWNYRSLEDKGLDYDVRQQLYAEIKGTTFDALKSFYDRHIKGKDYNYIVIGNKKDVDLTALDSLGKVNEVKLSDVFVD